MNLRDHDRPCEHDSRVNRLTGELIMFTEEQRHNGHSMVGPWCPGGAKVDLEKNVQKIVKTIFEAFPKA